MNINHYDGRKTPSTRRTPPTVAGLHDNPCGDDRYYNNLFVRRGDLSPYDEARLPVWMDGNVFLVRRQALQARDRPAPQTGVRSRAQAGRDGRRARSRTHARADFVVPERTRTLVTTELLGKAIIPNLPYEQPDGSGIRVDTDYFGKPRNEANPMPGPFEHPGAGRIVLKVW